ncbi:helix-turn-helix domain-containing protein [Cryobacterium sp. PH31-O1]|uniref:PucR family transcriptional regulator n=1 Tax=Cryobacterium sp. PH31-O1 TaxID=3046306 RepID=UPI0024BBC03C|nr:helix-turn-helix domain-containing protein [Cryobacterium sp. PH31-O1]MDJ0338055.1 helix-turn-helix domain-containing protein [Cryobacterium sp. PH31-O1]
MPDLFARPSTTVSALLAELPGSGLRLASGNPELRLSRTSPTLYEPWLSALRPRGGVLLGVGLHPGNNATGAAVRTAASDGFAAIVIRSFSLGVEDLAETADECGIALLIVGQNADWREIDSLITSALRATTEESGSLSSLPGGDLFALANAIAGMTGGATTIEGFKRQILAYSTLADQPIDNDRKLGILGREVPDAPENDQQYASLYRNPAAQHFVAASAEGAIARSAVGVRAGAQLLGSVWVIDASPRTAEILKSLDSAVDTIALHMLRARSTSDLVHEQRAELVRRLLQEGGDAHLVVGQLGLEPSSQFALVAFQPRAAGGSDEVGIRRLADLVTMMCESNEFGVACALVGRTVYALVSAPGALPAARVHALAERIVTRAGASLQVAVDAAIGSTVFAAGQISRSRDDADLVLLLLANRSVAGPVASAEACRGLLNLLELFHILRRTPRLQSPLAVRVLDHDAREGTSYAVTLRTYFDCSRDSAVTAERLSMHQNTLRYRLRRASEIFNIDLLNPDDVLMLWLTLRSAQFG